MNFCHPLKILTYTQCNTLRNVLFSNILFLAKAYKTMVTESIMNSCKHNLCQRKQVLANYGANFEEITYPKLKEMGDGRENMGLITLCHRETP